MTELAPLEMVETDILEQMFPYEDVDDPNKRAHVFRGEENDELWVDGMTGTDLVEKARMLGLEIVALCGHRLIPRHNPADVEACERCLYIWNKLGV